MVAHTFRLQTLSLCEDNLLLTASIHEEPNHKKKDIKHPLQQYLMSVFAKPLTAQLRFNKELASEWVRRCQDGKENDQIFDRRTNERLGLHAADVAASGGLL